MYLCMYLDKGEKISKANYLVLFQKTNETILPFVASKAELRKDFVCFLRLSDL